MYIPNARVLSPEEQAELVVKAQQGDECAARRLIECNLRMIMTEAGSCDRLHNAVALAEQKAIGKFKPDGGSNFLSYMMWWIRKVMRRGKTKLHTVPLDEQLVDLPSSSPTPFEEVVNAERRETAQMLLSCLDDRSRAIITARYGLDGRKPRTLMQLSAVHGVTKERIRQLQVEALKAMKKYAFELGIED